MRLTKQLFLSLLLAACVSAQASHEAKGGDPLKNRFRQIGKFLTYHLQHNQVRLGARLKSLDTFQATVPQVPIELVDEFPPAVTAKLKEPLTGMTVDDTESPVGKKILLHRQRFEAALKRFDDGQEVTLLVLRDARKLESEPNPETSLLVEGTFLGFCFHEFLLASHEADLRYELSGLLAASKKQLADWTGAHGALTDRSIAITLPRISGPVYLATGDDQADQRQALSGYAEVYANGGRATEQAALKAAQDKVSKQVPVLKAVLPNAKSPSSVYASCQAYVYKTCIQSYYTQKEARLYLDTDDELDYAFPDEIHGADISFPGGDPAGALQSAYPTAYQSFLDAVAQRLPELEKTYRALYGDDFVYLDLQKAEMDTRFVASSLPSTWPNAPIYFRAKPVVYYLKHDD